MSKTFTLPVLRVEPSLGERIKADQKSAGETTMATTLRRLIHRGLDNPFLRPDDIDQAAELIRQLTRLGVNLNTLMKKLNTHDDLKDFQRDELKAVIAALSVTGKKVRDLVDVSR